MKNYFVYILNEDGIGKKAERVTDAEHLDECIKYAKHDWNVSEVCVNEATYCYDGYLVQGNYKGKF